MSGGNRTSPRVAVQRATVASAGAARVTVTKAARAEAKEEDEFDGEVLTGELADSDDEAPRRVTKKARGATLNDRKRLRWYNGFVDDAGSTKLKGKVQVLSKSVIDLFTSAKEEGLAVVCTNCLWTKESEDIEVSKPGTMHVVCGGPGGAGTEVATASRWMASMESAMGERFARVAVRKWEVEGADVAEDETYFRAQFDAAMVHRDGVEGWTKEVEAMLQAKSREREEALQVSFSNTGAPKAAEGIAGADGEGALAGEMLEAHTQLGVVVSLLEQAGAESVAATQLDLIKQAVEHVLISKLLANGFIMKTPTGSECMVAKSGFMRIMGANKPKPGESLFVKTVAAAPKVTTATVKAAAVFLKKKVEEIEMRMRSTEAQATARVQVAAWSPRPAEGGKQAGKAAVGQVYLETEMEGASAPNMHKDMPGTVLQVDGKKGMYVKVRNNRFGQYFDNGSKVPASSAVLVAVRSQIPLELTGSATMTRLLTRNGYLFVKSFAAGVTQAMKDMLAKGRLPTAAILLSERRVTGQDLGAVFSTAVGELYKYSTATYSWQEQWTAGLRLVANDIEDKQGMHGFPAEVLMSAWDQTVASVEAQTCPRVIRLCGDYVRAADQVRQLVEQEQALLGDLFGVWSVQVQTEKSVTANLASKDADNARRDKVIGALQQQLHAGQLGKHP